LSLRTCLHSLQKSGSGLLRLNSVVGLEIMTSRQAERIVRNLLKSELAKRDFTEVAARKAANCLRFVRRLEQLTQLL